MKWLARPQRCGYATQRCVLSADLIQEDQVDGVDEDKLAQKHVQEYQALVFDLRTI
eukprot:SAG31_NODE_836_length_11643_cov_3.389813_1_plen_56_part_00